MRTLRRRAAVGATSAALLLAGVGSSLVAVRAARHGGGITASALSPPSRPAATEGDPGSGPGIAMDPVAGSPFEPGAPAIPGVVDPITGLPTPELGIGVGPSPPSPGSPAAGPGAAGQPGTGAPVLQTPLPAVPAPDATSDPAPTTAPTEEALSSCPSDVGGGAVPPGTGRLEAVDYSLPWPGDGPVVLVPQASAKRSQAPVRLAGSSIGSLASDGSSVTLTSYVPATEYVLVSGDEVAAGTIRFNQPGRTVHVERQACRDRSLALYDVNRATLDGSPLRIVGMVAPAGMVTIDGDGGTARFRSAIPGVYSVTLLTAIDSGIADTLVTATVTVP